MRGALIRRDHDTAANGVEQTRIVSHARYSKQERREVSAHRNRWFTLAFAAGR